MNIKLTKEQVRGTSLKEGQEIEVVFDENKKLNKRDLKRMFQENNKNYFDNSIPDYDVVFTDNLRPMILGQVDLDNRIIYLMKTPVMQTEPDIANLILLHEMIHAKNYSDYSIEEMDATGGGHGSLFKNEVDRVNKLLKYDIPYKEDISSLESVLDELGY